jgi:hypothetical protein
MRIYALNCSGGSEGQELIALRLARKTEDFKEQQLFEAAEGIEQVTGLDGSRATLLRGYLDV